MNIKQYQQLFLKTVPPNNFTYTHIKNMENKYPDNSSVIIRRINNKTLIIYFDEYNKIEYVYLPKRFKKSLKNNLLYKTKLTIKNFSKNGETIYYLALDDKIEEIIVDEPFINWYNLIKNLKSYGAFDQYKFLLNETYKDKTYNKDNKICIVLKYNNYSNKIYFDNNIEYINFRNIINNYLEYIEIDDVNHKNMLI